MKFSIEKVSNGYILRWIKTGLPMFKDPYEKEVRVFTDINNLILYLDETLEPQKPVEK